MKKKLNQENYEDVIEQDECKPDSVVYLKDCKGGSYTINAYSAKILIGKKKKIVSFNL